MDHSSSRLEARGGGGGHGGGGHGGGHGGGRGRGGGRGWRGGWGGGGGYGYGDYWPAYWDNFYYSRPFLDITTPTPVDPCPPGYYMSADGTCRPEMTAFAPPYVAENPATTSKRATPNSYDSMMMQGAPSFVPIMENAAKKKVVEGALILGGVAVGGIILGAIIGVLAQKASNAKKMSR